MKLSNRFWIMLAVTALATSLVGCAHPSHDSTGWAANPTDHTAKICRVANGDLVLCPRGGLVTLAGPQNFGGGHDATLYGSAVNDDPAPNEKTQRGAVAKAPDMTDELDEWADGICAAHGIATSSLSGASIALVTGGVVIGCYRDGKSTRFVLARFPNGPVTR